MAPREQDQARRAIAGLLSYLQRCGEEMGERLAVTALRRFSLESQLYMAPECFISLGIFADDHHPSAHGCTCPPPHAAAASHTPAAACSVQRAARSIQHATCTMLHAVGEDTTYEL